MRLTQALCGVLASATIVFALPVVNDRVALEARAKSAIGQTGTGYATYEGQESNLHPTNQLANSNTAFGQPFGHKTKLTEDVCILYRVKIGRYFRKARLLTYRVSIAS